jgi:LacI family transcriptional regulator
MRGAEDALGVGEMSAFLCDSRDDPIREQHYVRMLLSRRVDGIIVAGRRTEARAPLVPDPAVPVVYAFAPSKDPRDCSVVSDEAEGTRAAIRHLLATGHRRVAHVTGPLTHGAARLRAATTVDELTKNGVELQGDVWYGGWSETSGRSAGVALVRAHPEIDAIFCGSDQIARGVAEGLRDIGCRVPEEVALVGVDNWTVHAEASRPPLTTVDLNLLEVGRRAGELLLSAIDGEPSPGMHSVPCTLVVRESSRPDQRAPRNGEP